MIYLRPFRRARHSPSACLPLVEMDISIGGSFCHGRLFHERSATKSRYARHSVGCVRLGSRRFEGGAHRSGNNQSLGAVFPAPAPTSMSPSAPHQSNHRHGFRTFALTLVFCVSDATSEQVPLEGYDALASSTFLYRGAAPEAEGVMSALGFHAPLRMIQEGSTKPAARGAF